MSATVVPKKVIEQPSQSQIETENVRLAEEIEYFKANEEQDSLIERGLKLLTSKVLDLLTLCSQAGLDLDSEKQQTLLTHQQWKNSITSVYDELQSWELNHVGEEQFCKCFKFFIETLKKAPLIEQKIQQKNDDPNKIKTDRVDHNQPYVGDQGLQHMNSNLDQDNGNRLMKGGSLYHHMDYQPNDHIHMFDLPHGQRTEQRRSSNYEQLTGKQQKVSDIYLEQWKVVKHKDLIKNTSVISKPTRHAVKNQMGSFNSELNLLPKKNKKQVQTIVRTDPLQSASLNEAMVEAMAEASAAQKMALKNQISEHDREVFKRMKEQIAHDTPLQLGEASSTSQLQSFQSPQKYSRMGEPQVIIQDVEQEVVKLKFPDLMNSNGGITILREPSYSIGMKQGDSDPNAGKRIIVRHGNVGRGPHGKNFIHAEMDGTSNNDTQQGILVQDGNFNSGVNQGIDQNSYTQSIKKGGTPIRVQRLGKDQIATSVQNQDSAQSLPSLQVFGADHYTIMLKKQILAQKQNHNRKFGGGTREMLKDIKKSNTFGTGVPY